MSPHDVATSTFNNACIECWVSTFKGRSDVHNPMAQWGTSICWRRLPEWSEGGPDNIARNLNKSISPLQKPPSFSRTVSVNIIPAQHYKARYSAFLQHFKTSKTV